MCSDCGVWGFNHGSKQTSTLKLLCGVCVSVLELLPVPTCAWSVLGVCACAGAAANATVCGVCGVCVPVLELLLPVPTCAWSV